MHAGLVGQNYGVKLSNKCAFVEHQLIQELYIP